MMSSRMAALERPTLAERRISPDEAMRKAEGFLTRHLGHLLAAGTPWRVLFPLRSAWVVPVQLTYPGYGTVGEVGIVIVDEGTGDVVAWTSPEEMKQATERLYHEHEAEIGVAFQAIQREEG
ncbi:MAG: hypothetical protein ACE5NP_05170 [Anaerolineae bacterium]